MIFLTPKAQRTQSVLRELCAFVIKVVLLRMIGLVNQRLILLRSLVYNYGMWQTVQLALAKNFSLR